MRIGPVEIERTACLAPMAGVADRAFRMVCKEYGASYVVSEMASAKGICMSDRKTAELLTVTDVERPMAIQLFGDEPQTVARAAEKSMEYRPDILDINMGCPAPKIVNGKGGSALMRTPKLAEEIVRQVCDAVPIPVTVKIRKGWDEESVNAVEFAKRMEQSGAAAIAVHGRTRKQMYAPPVDLSIIRQVKEAVSIPVIGNGDVTSIDTCVEMYEQTGCDLVMIGRGALGNPYLFHQIGHYIRTGQRLPPMTLEEKMQLLLKHVKMICTFKGEHNGMKEARGHAIWYFKGMKGAAALRRQAGMLREYGDLEKLVAQVLESSQ